METVQPLKISRSKQSRLQDISLENVPFGKYFTDHMLVADYENGKWHAAEIIPYQPLMLDPSLSVFHYGQAIFEGIKAYKHPDGKIYIFRPYENLNRFNLSAQRMQMPEIPEEIFIDGLRALIDVDKEWVPVQENHSLYIRPFMISSEEAIGVRPGNKYKFIIILSPTGPYFPEPMRIYAEEKYVRAASGGVGFAKAAGNYGAALHPSVEAQKKGYDQVLWMDALQHKYVQECGVMNVFFIVGNKFLTPGLEEGTILAGVTRDTVITIAKEMGFPVEERPINIDEVTNAYNSGELKEIFGTGTAATIALIKELRYKNFDMVFNTSAWTIAPAIKQKIDAIRYGLVPDKHNWLLEV